jgi:hypothetical protein
MERTPLEMKLGCFYSDWKRGEESRERESHLTFFKLVNKIVDDRNLEKKEKVVPYAGLPKSALDEIKNRDGFPIS